MPRALTVLVVATLLVSAAATPAAAVLGLSSTATTTPAIQQYAAGPSFIVEYEAGSRASLESWVAASQKRQLIRVHNASQTATIAAPRWQVVDSFRARLFAGAPLATPLAARSYITDISPNYVLTNVAPITALANASTWSAPTEGRFQFDDPPFPTDGVAFDDVNRTTLARAADTTGAANLSATGAGQTVAVIDTGCNVAGGALGIQQDLLNESASFLGDDVETVTESGYDAVLDENGHGSWVTSSITANGSIDGLAPDAQVLCLQALNAEGSGSTSDIAAAIRYAADANASVDVLTMSLGSPVYSDALADAIQYALNSSNADIEAVTVATGNSRATMTFVASPADVAGVIGVGATTNQAPPQARSAYFSQVSGQSAADTSLKGGEQVDVAAPGMQLTAAVATTSNGIENRTLSGTSMATPLVAASLVRAFDANAALADNSPAELEALIQDTARPVPHAATAEVGHGMVASDNLAAGYTPAPSQAAARIQAAKARDVYYRSLAASSGGLLADLRKLREGS